VLAVGDNDRAAALSGVNVARVRTAAFVISATSAVIAGILLAGFAGVTSQVGSGSSSRRSPPRCSAGRYSAAAADR
jgi:ribose transport system permease protein